MPHLLWKTPFLAPAFLAAVAIVACGTLGSTLPDYEDLPPLNDATSSSSGPTGISPGAPSIASSSGGVGPDVSGGSSGSTSSSEGTSSSGSSGGSGSSGASSSSGTSVLGDGGASDAYVGYCGDKYCDYHSGTCCLPADAGSLDAAYCVSGTQYACGANIVTYHCLGAVDCPTSGDVCCGVFNIMAMTLGTSCQPPPCTNPQFCLGDPECNGPKCTAQSCLGISPLYLCGLQRGPPYNCTATP